MKRRAFAGSCAAAAAVAATALPTVARADELAYDLDTATGTLGGTLTLPPRPAPIPVALIIAGSGPTDRNGNSTMGGPGTALNMYLKLAGALASNGIASLRYDKRGAGTSRATAPPESAMRFGMYADDAAAWIARLRADHRFSKITIVGHSEGSLVGMLAAQRAPSDAFVSLEGAGFPIGRVLRAQLEAQLKGAPAIEARVEQIIGSLEKGVPVSNLSDLPPGLASLFRPSVQPYLISWMPIDPRVEIVKVPGTVTIVQGTHDLQTPVADGQALAAARPAAPYVLIADMTHVLTDDPGTTLTQQLAGAYVDATRPLDATLIATIATAAR